MSGDRTDILMLLSNPASADPRVSKEAATLAAAGYKVRVLGWDRAKAHPPTERGPYEIERMQSQSSFGSGLRQLRGFVVFWMWLVRRGRALRPRAVHAHDLDTFPAAYVIARSLRIPLVFDSHELYAEMQVGRVPGIVVKAIAALERFAMRNAAVAIVVSNIAKRYFAQVRPDTVIVGNWYSPVAGDAEAARAVRYELGVPEDAFLVGYAGGLMNGRNFDPLIAAAEADAKLYVLIAGIGDQADEIRRRAASLERLKYIGFTSEPQRYFNALDAMYYLYREDEHYGQFSASNALGRAMSYGKPLLTNHCGENGIVMDQVDPELLLRASTPDEVLRVVSVLRREGNAERVRRRIEKLARTEYSWEAAGAAVCRIYRHLIRKEGSAL